jgi:type IV pilus assembly protein PilV
MNAHVCGFGSAKRLRSNPKIHGRDLERGFTLVEVLVVILIMSIGMMGIAGLQAATSRYKLNSWVRASVSVLFNDWTDRVRASPDQSGLSYFSAGAALAPSAYTLTDTYAVQQADPLNVAIDCSATGAVWCTPAQMTAWDLTKWRREVRRLLPQGGAFITGNKAAGFEVTLMWFNKDASQVPAFPCPVDGPSTVVDGLSRVNCCPPAAQVPDGVFCLKTFFVP